MTGYVQRIGTTYVTTCTSRKSASISCMHELSSHGVGSVEEHLDPQKNELIGRNQQQQTSHELGWKKQEKDERHYFLL